MSARSQVSEPITVAILGLGAMGRAILAGLLDQASQASIDIRVTNATAEKAAEWDAVENVTAFSVEQHPDANRIATRDADVVILAVKPWQILPLLDEIAPELGSAVVVSVAAGITTAAMEARVAESVGVIRAMPNTPAIIQRGVTGLSAGSRASESELELVKSLFHAVGEVVVVPQDQIDALSAVSGSGPAYVYLLAECMIDAAQAVGLDERDARALVVGTFSGAAELLERSGEEPEELLRQVTTPKGTTEQAIAVLESADLRALFERALRAAMRRAGELASENR